MNAKEKARAKRLMDCYKLTPEMYDVISVYQNHVCYLCGQPEPTKGRRLSVDHDWSTGLIRGLLCSRCNPVLGKLERAYKRYALHKVAGLTFEKFLFSLHAYATLPPATIALGNSHYGYPGAVNTKAHRAKLRKEKKLRIV